MARSPIDVEIMDVTSAEEFVLGLLRAQGPMTTMEIEKLARKEHKHCPDQTVMFLIKMKKKGLIKGEASLERKGWVWWTP
jgi:predicted transcriptional regulator